MTKHTHKGTCQICGSTQAVNNDSGMLAKHGYTTRWGFFSGTCSGSGHLPLQVSCDLIKDSADAALRHGKALTEKAVELNNQTGPEGFYNVYIPATWQSRKSKHVWIRVTFADVEFENTTKLMMIPNQEDIKMYSLSDNRSIREMATMPAFRFGIYGVANTVDAYAKDSRIKRAEAYCRTAKEYFEYYAHQCEVLENWKPTELFAVKK